MKEYLSMEKSISDIIGKLQKLKKTAKDLCVKQYITKKGKPKKTMKFRSNINKSFNSKKDKSGAMFSNIYNKSQLSNVKFNFNKGKIKKQFKNNSNKVIEPSESTFQFSPMPESKPDLTPQLTMPESRPQLTMPDSRPELTMPESNPDLTMPESTPELSFMPDSTPKITTPETPSENTSIFDSFNKKENKSKNKNNI
jgi:hypothetical protein